MTKLLVQLVSLHSEDLQHATSVQQVGSFVINLFFIIQSLWNSFFILILNIGYKCTGITEQNPLGLPIPCDSGTYSNQGSSFCNDCPAGSFCPNKQGV